MKSFMFVWKSSILYDFRCCLYEISPCLREFHPVGWLAVIMCAATVGWRNLRVADRSAGGSGGLVGQKKHNSCELVSNARTGGSMSTSSSSFISGKGTGGQKGRQYFGYPGQDPKSLSQPYSSQHIQIPRSQWNFSMCCFHGLARMPMHCTEHQDAFFTNPRMHARDN